MIILWLQIHMGNYASLPECEKCHARIKDDETPYLVTLHGLGKFHKRTFCIVHFEEFLSVKLDKSFECL